MAFPLLRLFIRPTILLFLSQLQNTVNSLAIDNSDGCPSDCVCYNEYMSNLASWKWIETDVNIQKDDPLHEDFNPYTEHNEVFDNPAAVKKRQNERMLETVTCILRSNSSIALSSTLNKLKPSVGVLSLMQAPGSGNITLQKSHLENLHSLIGLEIQGYSTDNKHKKGDEDALNIAADAFGNLKKLTYLSMDGIVLQQRSVENDVHEFKGMMVRVNYTTTDENSIGNEIEPSEVIILQPLKAQNENTIVPYSVYKSESKVQPHPVQPKISVAFTKLPNLQHLRISGCNLQDISWDMFFRLDALKFLLLDNNDLLFLPDFVFYSTSNLTALSLSRNRILNLQTVGLVGLLYLQKLDVSYNNITHLSELSLPPFPHLEVADFRHNPIEAIFPNTFEVMNSTKTLFLGSPNTPIQFSPNSFYGLTSLIRLDIMNAKIEFLESPMFRGMPELRSLKITGAVTRISYDAFSEVAKLEKLVLKESSIRKISMDAFFGLRYLVELDLSHNEISFLPPGLFDEQLSLREVFLQYNKLKTLPPSLFTKIPAKLIRLEGNPWHCSCDMKYWDSRLINQVKRYHVPQPNSTNCLKQYDKGSSCDQNSNPTFQVRYAYEKRVSPVCQSPKKFNKKSVFQVLRRDLQYCANSLQQNISMILKASNPTETIEKMAALRISFDPIIKQREKELLFPKKVRKPTKESTSTSTLLRISNKSQSAINLNKSEPDNNIPLIANTQNSMNTFASVRFPSVVVQSTNANNSSDNLMSPSPSDTPTLAITSVTSEDTPEIFMSPAAPSDTPTAVTRTTTSELNTPEIQTTNKIKIKPPKIRNHKKKSEEQDGLISRNRNETVSNNNNMYPPVSRKALKLQRYTQKLLRKQQG